MKQFRSDRLLYLLCGLTCLFLFGRAWWVYLAGQWGALQAAVVVALACIGLPLAALVGWWCGQERRESDGADDGTWAALENAQGIARLQQRIEERKRS
jgi:uncharacterized membrane protein YfbV (UPF0208 family)